MRLANAIERKAAKAAGRAPMYYGVWIAAESIDANLSQVRVPGAAPDGASATVRFMPKLAHVTGLTTSSTVLCLGSPLCIIGILVGDISLAAI